MSFYSAIFSPNPNVFKNKLGVCVWMEWVGYICCQASLNPRLNFFPISVFPLALANIHFPSLNDPSELFHNFPVTFELNAHCTCSPFPSTGLTCALGSYGGPDGFPLFCSLSHSKHSKSRQVALSVSRTSSPTSKL